MGYYDGISEAILNNKALPVLASEAKQVIQIIEAAVQSHREKRIIDL